MRAQRETLVKNERLRAEVLNAVFKSERLKESDPEKALALIDQTIAKVESAELSTESAAPLMKQLNRTRSTLRNEIEAQGPNIALKAENKRVKDRIETEVQNAIRVDQDMVKLVDEYNELYKQQRFAEAVIVAKKAKELNPKEPTVVTMLLKAQFALQDKFITDLKADKEDSDINQLNDVERAVTCGCHGRSSVEVRPENLGFSEDAKTNTTVKTASRLKTKFTLTRVCRSEFRCTKTMFRLSKSSVRSRLWRTSILCSMKQAWKKSVSVPTRRSRSTSMASLSRVP